MKEGVSSNRQNVLLNKRYTKKITPRKIPRGWAYAFMELRFGGG